MDARDRATPTAEVTTERHLRILVIDDDRYVRMLLCDLLSAWGYEANVAVDGAEGLALFGRGSYDAVLTDLAMPNVSGLDVVAGEPLDIEHLRRALQDTLAGSASA
jgi:DNA-binding NtrC family response regulator